MSTLELLRYSFWGICLFSLLVFSAYAFSNLKLAKARTEHRLTVAGAIAFIISFAATAIADYVLPEPYLIYPAFIIWVIGVLALVVRETLRWTGIRRAYGASLSRTLSLYLETKHYLVSSSLFVLLALPVWVFFIFKPFGKVLSWIEVAFVAVWALAVMNLAVSEGRFYHKMEHQEVTTTRKPATPGRRDALIVSAWGEFINSFLAKVKPVAASPAINTLTEYFEDNPVLFAGCCPGEDGTINVEPILKNLNRIPEENQMPAISSSFSMITAKLTGVYCALASTRWAEKTIEDCYRSTERQFKNTSAVSDLLRIMPKGILENEKLAFLSKDEMEARVRERTQELEESRDQLRTLKDFHEQIVRKAPVGIVRTDKQGRMVFANPKAAEIIGLTDGENTTNETPGAADIFSVGEVVKAAGFNMESLRSMEHPGANVPGGEFHTNFTFTSGGGKGIEASISIAVLVDTAGQFDGLLLLIEDITARQALEEERQRIDKLKSIGALAGGIAHDFNNMLTGIMGNIGLAKVFIESKGRAFAILDEAEKASRRAGGLTQQLLTFSRGGLPVKKLVATRELTVESATFALRGSKVKPVFSLPDDLWAVDADEGQMNQVILNVARNADQAMPDGGALNISASNIVIGERSALPLAEGKFVKITFEDHGIGIPKENLPRIFEPYFTTKETGSGLGLATCYSIVRNHDGHISVESEPGAGTKVHIYLPASEKPAPPKEEAVRETQYRGKGRILVMEDEEMIREMMKQMLQFLGYEAELTNNGAEAIKRYREAKESGRPFEVVIMDLTVPGGMGGQEAIGRLLEIDPDVRAIVSSGYSTDGLMADPQKSGFRGAIRKPYSIVQLGKVIQSILKPQ